MPNNNAASRVRTLLEAAKKQSERKKAGEAWAAVLGVSIDEGRELWGPVGGRLGLVHDEIKEIRAQMQRTTREPELYEKALGKAERALGLANLSASWKSYRQHIDEHALGILGWCAGELPDDGRTIPAEDLEAIRELVVDLRTALESENVPEELRAFLLIQVRTIEEALERYPIMGQRAFGLAMIDVAMTLEEYRDVAEQYAAAEEMGTFRLLWDRFCRVVSRVERLARAAEPILKFGRAVFENVDRLPGA